MGGLSFGMGLSQYFIEKRKQNGLGSIAHRVKMTSINQQILIGLDAMEWDLVRQWASEGKLPVFRKLIETG
jgi:hypothetical protein